MKIKYQVITNVNLKEGGNRYDEMAFKSTYDFGAGKEVVYIVDDSKVHKNHTYISLKLPVFELGEVLIVEETGREITGKRRKADKWFVDYEEFTSLKKAVERALQIEENK